MPIHLLLYHHYFTTMLSPLIVTSLCQMAPSFLIIPLLPWTSFSLHFPWSDTWRHSPTWRLLPQLQSQIDTHPSFLPPTPTSVFYSRPVLWFPLLQTTTSLFLYPILLFLHHLGLGNFLLSSTLALLAQSHHFVRTSSETFPPLISPLLEVSPLQILRSLDKEMFCEMRKTFMANVDQLPQKLILFLLAPFDCSHHKYTLQRTQIILVFILTQMESLSH